MTDLSQLGPSPTPAASPTPLTIILRSSIEGTSDFFPFHDIVALNDRGSDDEFSFKRLLESGIGGGPEIVLFESGCLVDGAPDCPRACNDTALFFGSLETFYNCASLASIAYWTQDAKSYYVSDEGERNVSSIMGQSTLSEFPGRPVLNSFIGCAQDSCDNDNLATPCDHAIDQLSKDESSAEEIFAAMDTFCPNLTAQINPDIFGPGVLISYVLQVSFSAVLYLLTKGFTFWVRFTQGSRPKAVTIQRRMTRIESMIWRDSSAMSRTSIAIATTLVEFQEAQAWFVFAVQIASILAIVVNSQEGTFWGEIVLNGAIAYHVSQNGVLPMFLIQVCLHHEGIRNWHTFFGFFAEYILAIVATTQKLHYKDAFDLFRKENPISGCGLNPSPRTYCAETSGVDGLQISFFPHPMLYKMNFLILDTIAILILSFDQLAWTLREHHKTQDIQIGNYRVGHWPDGRLKPFWLKLKRWSWRVLEVAYFIINILYMVSLTKVINGQSFVSNRWSYGQIIAMTVWGPVIVKMVDLILSGPPKNDGRRLNSGPPRLRIDNVINGRIGTSADEILEEEGYLPDETDQDSTNVSADQEQGIHDNAEGASREKSTQGEDGAGWRRAS